jgi:hypothetical protein
MSYGGCTIKRLPVNPFVFRCKLLKYGIVECHLNGKTR